MDLNIRWQMFDELFLPSENYTVFNESGAAFWNMVQDNLLDVLFMSISRFFDRARMGIRDNLSLLAVIDFEEVSSIRADLAEREMKMRALWEAGIKVWRHKRISHADLQVALDPSLLPEVNFSSVKELVDEISEFARAIILEICRYDQSYHVGISNWVPQVLDIITIGIEQRKQQLEKDRAQIEKLTALTDL